MALCELADYGVGSLTVAVRCELVDHGAGSQRADACCYFKKAAAWPQWDHKVVFFEGEYVSGCCGVVHVDHYTGLAKDVNL